MDSVKNQLSAGLIIQTEARLYWQSLITAYWQGASVLPHRLGLPENKFNSLIEYLRSLDLVSGEDDLDPQNIGIQHKRSVVDELLEYRREERDTIANLLLQVTDNKLPHSEAMALIIATASLGSHHLWQDLGLPDRQQLNALIQLFFPSLHASNTRGMRWKRFIYKQLCEQGGDYVCRAPSCDECSSFSECFAPEE